MVQIWSFDYNKASKLFPANVNIAMNGKDGHTLKFEKESPKNTGAKKHSTELT